MNSVCAYQTSGMVSRAGASLPQMPGGFWCSLRHCPPTFHFATVIIRSVVVV